MTMTNAALDRIMQKTEGRIVQISFIKDNGYSRTINGRVGVKYKGKTSGYRMDSTNRAFFLVYSMRDQGFRRIDIERVVSIKVDGLYIFNASLIEKAHTVA